MFVSNFSRSFFLEYCTHKWNQDYWEEMAERADYMGLINVDLRDKKILSAVFFVKHYKQENPKPIIKRIYTSQVDESTITRFASIRRISLEKLWKYIDDQVDDTIRKEIRDWGKYFISDSELNLSINDMRLKAGKYILPCNQENE